MSKTYHLVESTTQATHYYIIPQHQALIPKCSNSQRVLITLLSSKHDICNPTMVSEYPTVTRKHANMFGWMTYTVKVHYTKQVSYRDIAEKAMVEKEQAEQAFIKSCGIDLDAL